LDGEFVLQGEDDGVAGAGVEFEDFFAEFVFHRQAQARKIGAFLGVVDDDVVDFRAEAEEDAAYEVVREGAVWFCAVKGHLDDDANRVVGVDDEVFGVVAKEDGAAVCRGHDVFDGDFNVVGFHGIIFSGWR